MNASSSEFLGSRSRTGQSRDWLLAGSGIAGLSLLLRLLRRFLRSCLLRRRSLGCHLLHRSFLRRGFLRRNFLLCSSSSVRRLFRGGFFRRGSPLHRRFGLLLRWLGWRLFRCRGLGDRRPHCFLRLGSRRDRLFAHRSGLCFLSWSRPGCCSSRRRRRHSSLRFASPFHRSRCFAAWGWRCCGRCRFATSALGLRRRWRRWWFIRLQEIHHLGMRSQPAVQQQQERLVHHLLVFRELRRDSELCHFREWQFFFYLAPLPEEVLQLLIDRLLLGGEAEKQNIFRRCFGKQLP